MVLPLLRARATTGVALAQQAATVVGTLDGHADPVYSIVWSPDGKTLVTGAFDNTVRLWDAATRKEIKKFAPVIEWLRLQEPPRVVRDIVTQDEYTHDVIVPWSERLVLVFDAT